MTRLICERKKWEEKCPGVSPERHNSSVKASSMDRGGEEARDGQPTNKLKLRKNCVPTLFASQVAAVDVSDWASAALHLSRPRSTGSRPPSEFHQLSACNHSRGHAKFNLTKPRIFPTLSGPSVRGVGPAWATATAASSNLVWIKVRRPTPGKVL